MQSLFDAPGAVTGEPRESALERVRSFLRGNLDLQLRALPPLAAEADVLLGSSLIHGGSSVAAALGKPFLRVHFSPNAFPSGSYAPPGVAASDGAGTRTTAWADYGRRFDDELLVCLNAYRREQGLPEAPGLFSLGSTEHVLLACDPVLAEAPSPKGIHTPRRITQTGYWYAAQDPTHDDDLAPWLATLPCAPLYAGFGSVPVAGWPRFVRRLLRVCQELGRPVVLVDKDTGVIDRSRGELGESLLAWAAGHVRAVAEVPHAWLFPRCWAVFHHGGAGTVATAARAGVPQIVLPQARGSDQRMWLDRLETLGVGMGVVADADGNESDLHGALLSAERGHLAMAKRAKSIQRALSEADMRARPVDVAADAIEAAVASHHLGADVERRRHAEP